MRDSAGTVLPYPKGSFTVDNLLEAQNIQNSLITSCATTPNTFITYVDDSFCFYNLRCSVRGGVGFTSGFNYYESTIWLLKRNQKEQVPFFFNLQTINIFNNIRWSFVQRTDRILIDSTTDFFPAAVWPERELQDMFLVSFSNLRDTRRLLLDYKLGRGVLSPKYKQSGVSMFSSFYDVYYV